MTDTKNKRILTTEKVEDQKRREGQGEIIHNSDKIWFKNIKGVRKSNLSFSMTKQEYDEYVKCKLNTQYFAQKYCQIKREDGTIGPMTLRDYQKDIIDLYTENRYSILMASRQVGKCSSFNTKIMVQYIDDDYGLVTEDITLGELYFRYLSYYGKLSILQKVKRLLYKLYNKL